MISWRYFRGVCRQYPSPAFGLGWVGAAASERDDGGGEAERWFALRPCSLIRRERTRFLYRIGWKGYGNGYGSLSAVREKTCREAFRWKSPDVSASLIRFAGWSCSITPCETQAIRLRSFIRLGFDPPTSSLHPDPPSSSYRSS